MKQFLVSLDRTGTARLILPVAAGFSLFEMVVYLMLDIVMPLLAAVIGTNLLQDLIHLRGDGPEPVRQSQIFLAYGRFLGYGLACGILVLVLKLYLTRSVEQELDEVECPYCLSAIPSEASRCAFCGSDIEPETEQVVVS